MKPNSIFVDFSNKEQVKWWNTIGHKLVKVVCYNELVETETNKPVGVFFMLKGFLSGYVIKKNNSFVKDLVTGVFDVKD